MGVLQAIGKTAEVAWDGFVGLIKPAEAVLKNSYEFVAHTKVGRLFAGLTGGTAVGAGAVEAYDKHEQKRAGFNARQAVEAAELRRNIAESQVKVRETISNLGQYNRVNDNNYWSNLVRGNDRGMGAPNNHQPDIDMPPADLPVVTQK
jgi:hypothetical protein